MGAQYCSDVLGVGRDPQLGPFDAEMRWSESLSHTFFKYCRLHNNISKQIKQISYDITSLYATSSLDIFMQRI